MHVTCTKERREDGEESPGGDLEVVDVGVVRFLAMDEDDVAVP